MAQNSQIANSPTKGVWRRFLILVPLTIVLVIACRAYIHSVGSEYTAYGKLSIDRQAAPIDDVAMSQDGIVEIADIGMTDAGHVRIVFRSEADGETDVTVKAGDTTQYWFLRVENVTIIDGGVNFSG